MYQNVKTAIFTYHKKNQTLRCHYCNFEIPFHKVCESCNEGKMKDIGIGTEELKLR